jgi:hypothetical protein
MIEAEGDPFPDDWRVLRFAAASQGVCVRSTAGDSGTWLERTFEVPAAATYRLFAALWKAQSDLVNVRVDGEGKYVLQAVHDMDANTFPIWSLGCSLGDAAIVRYWQGDPVRNIAPYSAQAMQQVPTPGQ